VTDEVGREPLQLVLASLLYQRWAIAGLDEGSFHSTVRDNPMTMADLVASPIDPLNDRHHVGATMHLASASIRLPVGVHQAARLRQRGADFEGLYGQGNDEWPRGRACRYLGEIQRLEHCGPGLTLPVAMVALLLFRDEFGHGEEGTGEEHWRRDRNETMKKLHRCRIVEAQQVLAGWSFNTMERATG
jgi:hypothetical protein